MLDLRGLMEEVGTLKAERETIERTLRDNVADISEHGEGWGGGSRATYQLGVELVDSLSPPPPPPSPPPPPPPPPPPSPLPAPKFLQALKDFGDVDEEAISEAHLRTEYGHLQTQVSVMGSGGDERWDG